MLAHRLAETLLQSASLLPVRVQAAAVEPVLNRVLRDGVEPKALDPLEGRVIGIAVNRPRLAWQFRVQTGRVSLVQGRRSEVTITGGIPEFLLLLARLEDPDTLFFQRRLVVEGDTELGLLLKNILDSIDPESLPFPLRHALALTAGQQA